MVRNLQAAAEWTGESWVLWECKAPVLQLLEKQTESLHGERDAKPDKSIVPPAILQPTAIERRRYQAVMDRMHQAAGRAGAFSAWTGGNT